MQILYLVYALIFGLCFGSFANVVIYRLPKNMSVVKPPSHCTSCDKRLAGKDLIPLFSYMLLKGRCRYCGAKISLRYPAVEAAVGLLFCLMALRAGGALSVIPLCLLAFVLFCVSLIDADIQEIPDGLLIFGSVIGLAWAAASHFFPRAFIQVWNIFNLFPAVHAPFWLDALIGIFAGALPLLLIDRLTVLIVKKDGFGYGDVKLMAMAGLFVGWKLILISFLFAFIAGGAYAAFLLFTRRAEKGSYLAFGPFLSAGIILALFFGEPFLSFLL